MLFRLSRFLLHVFLVTCFKFKVYGKENIPKPPYLVVPNHTSNLDPPLVGVACKKYFIDFMAKQEMFDSPKIGWWTRLVNCIPVDRESKSPASLKIAIKRIRKGRVVCIFPEGTRSDDGSLKAAKRGVGFLISKAQVPVLPVYVDGSLVAFPRGGKIKFGSPLTVYIGKPISQAELAYKTDVGKPDFDRITATVMDRIAELGKNVKSPSL